MSNEKIIKLLVFNTLIAIANVVIFSPGIIGLKIQGGSIFEVAFGVTIILMSIIIFVLGNYKILIKKEEKITTDKIETLEDYIDALKRNRRKKTFSKDIDIILEQIERIEKKKEIVYEIISEKFNASEISYSKFNTVITQIEKLFYINIKSVINKLNIFDEDDYDDMNNEKLSQAFINEKRKIYNEYISFIRNSIEDNEEILLKIDKFLLELSKFDSLEDGELENMEAMKEIDDLISKIKFYK